jgi:guanylate kinase
MEKHSHDQPPIIVISGAIGSGKGTIVHALVHELGLTWVPTHTTRPMRKDDAVISHRIFDTETNFLRHRDRGELIEWIELAGHYYGLLRHDLEQALNHNKPVIIELTIDGGIKVAKEYPNNTILLHITTDEKTRRERITHRNMNATEIEARMQEGRREDKQAREHCDYIIENIENYPEAAISAIKQILAETFPHTFAAAH